MSITDPSNSAAPGPSFTLRDLYVRASISGNSLATELNTYLNIDKTAFASSSAQDAELNVSSAQPTIHEQALSAILEVVASDVNTTFEYVRVPEPPGGVHEWWARMLSGSMDFSPSVTGRHSTDQSQ